MGVQVPGKKKTQKTLNGQAEVGVNGRCEAAEILHKHPETIVFVAAGGGEQVDREFMCDALHQSHTGGCGKC